MQRQHQDTFFIRQLARRKPYPYACGATDCLRSLSRPRKGQGGRAILDGFPSQGL